MSNQNIFLLVLILFVTSKIFCAGTNDQRTNIDSIIQKAKAVVLSDDCTFVVYDNDNAEYTIHTKILIKNKTADNYCSLTLLENDFKDIKDINAVLRDTLGNVIRELDNDDIETAEVNPDYDYYSDEKYKSFTLSDGKYPFIFDYSYKIKINSLFFWPDWTPEYSIPVLSATYTLKMEKDIKFKYLQQGIESKPDITKNDDETVYTWRLKNIPPRKTEDYMPPEDKIGKAIYFVPLKFNVNGFEGGFANWNDFAGWYTKLNEDRFGLPPKAVSEIKALVKNAKNTFDKIQILYKYLEAQDRYVAIELGLAGWQPQKASEVYVNHYGDCKDLTTYLVSMLRAVGIKAYPALALTRDDGTVNRNFPSNQFNHSIALVPMGKDSLWLECTATYMNAGEMPADIQGIDALVITGNGGKLIRTPIKSYNENLWSSNNKCTLTISGNLKFNINLALGGIQKEYFRPYLSYYNKKNELVFLKRNFGRHYSNITIDSIKVDNPPSSTKNYVISLKGVYNNIAPAAGNLIFINPNLYNRKSPKRLPDEDPRERKFPVYYESPYVDVDTVEIDIPSGYNLMAKPSDIKLTEPFGSFYANYKFHNGKIFYHRKFEINEREIPLNQYKGYKNFIRKVIKADQSQYVLKRQ